MDSSSFIRFTNNIASTNATIYFREDSTVYSDNLTFTDNIIPNGLHIVGENHIYAPVIYVNMSQNGFGIIGDEPASFEHDRHLIMKDVSSPQLLPILNLMLFSFINFLL